MRYLLPVIIAAATLVTAVVGGFPATAPGEAVAAMFPPWWGRERATTAGAAAQAETACLGRALPSCPSPWPGHRRDHAASPQHRWLDAMKRWPVMASLS